MRIVRQGASLTVLTPAKLNLSLKILGRRTDGFHDLETSMVSVRLHDELIFSPAPNSDTRLTVTTSFRNVSAPSLLPVDDRNLVIRALLALRRATGCQSGVCIRLHKRIPAEAGMGGGSSDAAATLVGLNQFWSLQLTNSQLHEIAAELGSDVNFFLDSLSAAICTGRGEQVSEVQLPLPLHLVIVKPPTGLSTAAVFKRWSFLKEASELSLSQHESGSLSDVRKLVDVRQLLVNDLQPPAEELNPDVRGVLATFRRLGVFGSAMTGSGSACFGLCRTRRESLRVAGQLRQLQLGQVWATSTGV